MSAEPPSKRRKISEDSKVSVETKVEVDDISDDELREAIRLSLLESESVNEPSVQTTQQKPEEPKKTLSPLEEIRMIQQQRYQQSMVKENKNTSPDTSLRPLQPKPESTEKAPKLASTPPSGLNLQGKRVFLNKLSAKDPDLAIHLEDIVCKGQVKAGILSGIFDEALSELNYFFSESTPLVLCTKPTLGPQGLPMGLLSAPKSWTLAYSNSLVHAKFMVLFYESYARIIIASGNFTKVEYKEIRQVFWYQDFPRTDVPKTPKGSFETNLRLFLQALSVPESWIARLDAFDLSTATPTLILSIPQNERIESQTGLYHLFQASQKIMKTKGAAPTLALLGSKPAATKIVVQANTVSLASDYWLKEFAGAVVGVKALPGTAAAVADSLQIVYPTDTVFRASGVQGDAFSVVLFKDQNPKHRFFSCRDISGANVLLHSKVIYPESKAWYYIGSHNLTKSAWGSSKSAPSNYELGIVFPAGEGWEFQVPFQTPLVPYGNSNQLGGVVRSWSPN